jgi:3,4-dihydroxy 2-butanone 4-phosphate synthase/GTP cyclohydrolase II
MTTTGETSKEEYRPLPQGIATAEEIIAEARAGRMVILVDDEDRENEGDLVIPAECADERAIAFMARKACGLICLALTEERVDALGLPPMHAYNGMRHETAFTISIEAREGVTTGISALDRAHTIATAIDPQIRRSDIVSPGHVFPLRARAGGVLMRAGHTEAAVDLARLAGRAPSGVICEIMKEDGRMARLPDLLAFGAEHSLKVGTIADLIAYRRKTEKLVRKVIERQLDSLPGGSWNVQVYEDLVHGTEHLVFVHGAAPADGRPPLVWIHAADTLEDYLDPERGMRAAMLRIAEAGWGAAVLIRGQARQSFASQIAHFDTVASSRKTKFRDYGLGIQILQDLGIERFRLLRGTTPPLPGLEGYAVEVVGNVA